MCVCVCVREREHERERIHKNNGSPSVLHFLFRHKGDRYANKMTCLAAEAQDDGLEDGKDFKKSIFFKKKVCSGHTDIHT